MSYETPVQIRNVFAGQYLCGDGLFDMSKRLDSIKSVAKGMSFCWQVN